MLRQGEWFFVPATLEELAWVEEHKQLVRRNARIGRGRGKPHVAQEYLDMFARGTVRHADHAPVRLKGWHKVLRNTEDRGTGTHWID